jgi:CRISPR-associated endoribonuclease Cas6
MSDFQVYEISLRNQDGPLPLRAVRGESLRGLFYSQLGPELSNMLHDFGQEKQEGLTAPYSVAILSERGNVTGLRIAAFQAELGERVAGAWALLAARREIIRLGNASLEVLRMRPGWLNGETFAGLYEQSQAAYGVTLEFLSPTFIERNNHFDLLPVPKWLWGFYMRRWEQYSPVDLPPKFELWVEKCVYTRRISLETRTSHTKSDKELRGMLGTIEFHALMKDDDLPQSRVDDYLRSWQALAMFAELCGTGKYTTEGFGRTRFVKAFGLPD